MPMLMPIKQKRISDQIFEQIRELIFRGTLLPGEKLLTEREMAKAMAVSRTSVRNAVTRLVATGLVEQCRGRGTFVARVDTQNSFPFAPMGEPEPLSITDLLEVRMGLECYAAALAAQRADEADIRAMDKSLRDMKTAFAAGRPGVRADVSFHMAIAEATKNPMHTFIINSFSNYLFHGKRKLVGRLYEEKKNTDRVLEQHAGIIDQIKNRNPDRAFAAMKRHIAFLSDFIAQRRQGKGT